VIGGDKAPVEELADTGDFFFEGFVDTGD